VTSYFEWLGAGLYRVDERSGSMHGSKFLVRELHFGSDGENFYLRLDFQPGTEAELAGMEVRINLQSLDQGATPYAATICFDGATVRCPQPAECAFAARSGSEVPTWVAGVAAGGGLKFQLSLWQGGLPLDAVPRQGWIEMASTSDVGD